jgi:glutathione S-transferase
MITIYGVQFSVHTRKAIFTAHYKGLKFDVVPVVPVIPGNPPENWSDFSPSRRIPALTDDGFKTSDSSAVCVYLERAYPKPALYPADARDYARAISFEAYATEVLFRDLVRTLLHETFVHPKIEGRPTNQTVVDEALSKKLPEIFGYLDSALHGKFLVGDQISIADISVVSNLIVHQYAGFDLHRQQYPKLAKLFDEVTMHPAMRATLRAEIDVVRATGFPTDFLAKALA